MILGISITTALVIGILIFGYQNTHDGAKDTKRIKKAGFSEKQAALPDGSILNYGEGPSGGTPLLLLHGQIVSWEDYEKVLPKLSRHYHIYAVDCYGHGGSSKDPKKYTANAIGTDLAWFMQNVIGKPAVVSGHSSGALLTAWLAANAPDYVLGVVMEDGPFFATEPGRAERTYAWLGFRVTHDFLNQAEEPNYTRYYLKHHYMKIFFNQDGKDNWSKIIQNPALKYMDKHPGKIPSIWFYPVSLGVNRIYRLSANMQDGTGEYDLRFGDTFYDFSWFDGFVQEETLRLISCPAVLLHVAPGRQTAPGYYDANGILLSAMDEKDARRAAELIGGCELIGGFKSAHDIHADCPEQFTQVMLDFQKRVRQTD